MTCYDNALCTLQHAKSAVDHEVGDQVLAYTKLICGFFVFGLLLNTDCYFRNFLDNFKGFNVQCRQIIT